MTIQEALQRSIKRMREAGVQTARLDAELLLAKAVGEHKDRLILLYEKELMAEVHDSFHALIERRLQGESVAYLLGRRGFYKHDFLVGPGVLVPRPETELIVERALQDFPQSDAPLCICELGVGSGCIGLSILFERPQAKLLGVELSSEALGYARKNAEVMKLDHRAEFVHSSAEEMDWQSIDCGFDILVANPPYIERGDPQLCPDVKKHEPELALFAEEGTLVTKGWMNIAKQVLKPGGRCYFEFGVGQGEELRCFLLSLGGFTNIDLHADLSGRDRMIQATRQAMIQPQGEK